ncbi:TPA: acetyl-CoA decarbonylase/synthase complex subunit gamma, partial [Candidatus Bipolaricaulota bacterium]|nr:acetyl-CoA decarbonylase/synthase complex subunit gamma [Candidatus Bipolaricaulota bacterium]
MAKRLTGIEIYKLLPRTNCRDCGFPTCMAFAMQVAAKKVALDQCPHVSEEAKAALGEAQAPPMRTVTIGTGDRAWEVGGETVLFRHEEKFHRPCAIAVRVPDDLPPQELSARVKEATSLRFVRIGQEIGVNLIAVEHRGGDFPTAVQAAREGTDLPLMLICEDPDLLGKALAACGDGRPLLYPATSGNLEAMAALAVEHSCPLGVKGDGVEGLAALTGKLKELGVEDLVLDPGARGLLPTLTALVHLRRLALVKTSRPVGYPTLAFAVGDDPYELLAQG